MLLNLFGCFFSSAEKKKEEVVFRFAWRYREMCLKLIRAEGKLASGIWHLVVFHEYFTWAIFALIIVIINKYFWKDIIIS